MLSAHLFIHSIKRVLTHAHTLIARGDDRGSVTMSLARARTVAVKRAPPPLGSHHRSTNTSPSATVAVVTCAPCVHARPVGTRGRTWGERERRGGRKKGGREREKEERKEGAELASEGRRGERGGEEEKEEEERRRAVLRRWTWRVRRSKSYKCRPAEPRHEPLSQPQVTSYFPAP